MENDINTKARLAFVALLFTLTAAGVIWYFFSINEYAVYQITTQDSVSGLIADAPVEFHGVDVGKVKSVKLMNAHSVRILLNIDKSAPISSASVATISARGFATRAFMGYVYVTIEDVDTDSRPLTIPPGRPYPAIRVAPSTSITLDTTANQVKENVQVITGLLQAVLDKKTVASLKQSVDSLQRVTKVLAENTGKLNTIVANTERASHRFRPLLDASRDTVRTLQNQTLPETHKAFSNLDTLLDSSHDTVRALQTQILQEAYKTLSNLDALSSSVTSIAAKISRDPSIVIRGAAPPPAGPGEGK
jgi:phospholipid/cholesterol/gamma-HCH transport system substrate-binding protein